MKDNRSDEMVMALACNDSRTASEQLARTKKPGHRVRWRLLALKAPTGLSGNKQQARKLAMGHGDGWIRRVVLIQGVCIRYRNWAMKLVA